MKITFISPYSNITAMGVRSLSSVLKRAGHQTQMIFLPQIPAPDDPRPDFAIEYADNTLEEVAEICRDSHLVGISLMSNYFPHAVRLTERIKKRSNPLVIWGGIHPTIKPQECINYADMVCVGEGEDAILDLVQRLESGADHYETPNIWFAKNGSTIQNSTRPLIKDLNSLPFPDYNLNDQFIFDSGRIQRLTDELMCKHLKRASIAESMKLVCYQTMATRGCPFHCSFCCNDVFIKMYKHQKLLRFRSPENIIDELVEVKRQWPFISGVWFSDDSLLAMPLQEIKRLSSLYKERIGLPFFCLTLPVSVNEEKLDHLADAGLILIKMGIQSGSQKSLELYNRKISNQRVLDATRIINKYKDRMLKPGYDIILDNPYETEDDIIETLELLLEIPRPYRLEIYSLTFFPGTELYEKAKKDGIIKDDQGDIYRKSYYARGINYLNILFTLFNYNIPKPLLKILINKKVVNLFHRKSLNWLYRFLFSVFKGLKGSLRTMKTRHSPLPQPSPLQVIDPKGRGLRGRG